MKLALACLGLLLASCAASPSAAPPSVHKDSRVSIYLGQRSLDEDDWEPIDEQGVFGVEYSRETEGSAVGFEVGLMGSGDEDDLGGADIEGSIGELYGGVRKTFLDGVVRPYVGGGLSILTAEVDIDGVGDDDDTSPALYLHGGVDFDITESFFLGLDLRFLFASDIELHGLEGDADYGQLALVLGFAF
jgi:opacity protein-like surface antigen